MIENIMPDMYQKSIFDINYKKLKKFPKLEGNLKLIANNIIRGDKIKT